MHTIVDGVFARPALRRDHSKGPLPDLSISILINPAHGDVTKIEIGQSAVYHFDPRSAKQAGGRFHLKLFDPSQGILSFLVVNTRKRIFDHAVIFKEAPV